MEIPTRNTIFLQGVFFSQIQTAEELMIEEIMSRNAASKEDDTANAQLSIRTTQFKNKKQWSEAYKDQMLKCWYCGFSFKMKMPSFIPRQIRNTPSGKVYDAYGLFCGFACAFTFLKNHAEFVRDKSYFDKLSMLKMLFTQFHGKRVIEFKEAPCVYDLTLYGGHIDSVDYRNDLMAINQSIINESL